MPSIWGQVAWLLILAVPVACAAWTVTHEELFKEPRDYFTAQSENTRRSWPLRKFYYMLTCEYCFSHYVAIAFLALTGFRMLLPDWRGVLIGGLALVWVANIYMSIFGRLRLEIKKERVDIEMKEKVLDES
jgi:hypothetical protein